MTYVPLPGDGKPHTVTLIPGDGIGPEVTDAVTEVVEALGAPIIWERCAGASIAPAAGCPAAAAPTRAESPCVMSEGNHPPQHSVRTAWVVAWRARRTMACQCMLRHATTLPVCEQRWVSVSLTRGRPPQQRLRMAVQWTVPGNVKPMFVAERFSEISSTDSGGRLKCEQWSSRSVPLSGVEQDGFSIPTTCCAEQLQFATVIVDGSDCPAVCHVHLQV